MVSPTPNRFINASNVVNVVFNDVDICVPAASVWRTSFTSGVRFFSCDSSALRISSRSVLTCPGSFSATAANRSTDAAICVEF